ncbi:hypothetical protein ACF0H5_022063 [Mactra antiquata]
MNFLKLNMNIFGKRQAFFVLLMALYFEVGDCIQCLSCKNTVEPSVCETAIECPENQACYIESVMSMTAGYQLRYNLGCKPLTTCNLIKCSKQLFDIHENHNINIKKRDISVCNECCYDNMCNAEGCGYKQKIGVTKCYDCRGVYNGSDTCTEWMDCDLTRDTCSVTISQHSIHPGAYDLGCTRKLQCEVLLSLQGDKIDSNTKCCGKFLCNGNPYNPSVNASSALAMKCPPSLVKPPTTPIPTTPTTTPAPTTTTTVPTTTTTHRKTLMCIHCDSATYIEDCLGNRTCDGMTESCYMTEIITDQQTHIYNGGCRSKMECSAGAGKKRNIVYACSRCCDFDDGCNSQLCGIKRGHGAEIIG